MNIKKFNESGEKKIHLSIEDINTLDDNDLKRVIIAYGDGQGDTYLKNLYDEIMFDHYDNPYDYIDSLYEDFGGNMVKLGWIENNQLVELMIKY